MSEVEKLRDEILNYQSRKHDLFKWKLILMGTVSAIGLGLTDSPNANGSAALCAVPFIAAYCDLLIRNYDLRIALNGFFSLKHVGGIFSEYETFMCSEDVSNTKWAVFNNYALLASSLLTCACLFLTGIFKLLSTQTDNPIVWITLIAVAAVGAVFVLAIEFFFHRTFSRIKKLCIGEPEP